MTKEHRFIAVMCGIGAVQLALIILKATGLISLGWETVFIPLEAVVAASALLFLYLIVCLLLFLYLIVCLVEDIKNGVFTEGYRDDGNGEDGNGEG